MSLPGAARVPAGGAGVASRPLILDGAMSTELQRRGCSVAFPWWGTAALRDDAGRALVRAIHEEFVAAGAEVITANTFRTGLHALRLAGAEGAAADELVAAAITMAREARGDRPVTLAASVAPVRDCYHPELVPDAVTLRAEHRWHVERLVAAGAELILVETMNSRREALAALAEAGRVGVPAWVSFVCAGGGRLLSGEDVAEAGRAVADAGAEVVLINCTPLADAREALRRLQPLGVPLGLYPNVEDRSEIPTGQHVDRYVAAALTPAETGRSVARLAAEFDLAVVGGCCGTSPEHLAAIRLATRLER